VPELLPPNLKAVTLPLPLPLPHQCPGNNDIYIYTHTFPLGKNIMIAGAEVPFSLV
jgi:hypothetical protein